MQPIVEITEHTDYASWREFQAFASRRQPMAWINRIIIYGLVPAAALLTLLVIWHRGELTAFTVGYPLFSILLIVVQATAPRRVFKKLHGKSVTVTNTAFFEDYFAYTATGENSTRSGSFRYENVARAFETASAFYLQQGTKLEWYLLPKKFFAPGQVEILRELFARKFGEKFKIK